MPADIYAAMLAAPDFSNGVHPRDNSTLAEHRKSLCHDAVPPDRRWTGAVRKRSNPPTAFGTDHRDSGGSGDDE